MSNTSNFLIMNDYKNDQKEDYMNIAKHNEENFETEKFEKYKSKNSSKGFNNLLKGEENKLKSMLFSILKHEESQTKIEGKSSNNHNKNILPNSNLISSTEDENKIKKPLNKNYKQFKKCSKSLNIKFGSKMKKSKPVTESLNNNFPLKKTNSNLLIPDQEDVKKTSSLEVHKSQKEITNIHSNISNKKESRNNFNSCNKSEKDYNSDDNQTSTKCLKLSSKNLIQKNNNEIPIFLNQKENKNCNDNIASEVDNLKNFCTFNNKNNETKKKKYNRSCSLNNQKNFMAENCNVLSHKKFKKSVSINIKDVKNIKNSLVDINKGDKNINQLKVNNILKINKEKIRRSFGIFNDDQNNESKHCESSCVNHKERPKIHDQLILQPQRFNSTKEPNRNLKNTLAKIYKNEKFNKKETSKKMLIKIMTIKEKYRKLTLKRPVYDSLDDEESEFEEMASNNFYIDPNSKFCFIFDLIIFFLTAYTSLAIPYFLAKNKRICKGVYFSYFHLLNCLSELFNTIDTILGFFRAYYNYDEQLITKSKLMIINYISSWFLIDLISSIPFYSIFNSYEFECNDKIFNKYYNYETHNLHYLFLCAKMIKSLKIFKNNRGYKKICKILNHYLIFQDKGALIAKTYTIILIFHFGACLHIFIGRNSYPNWILNMKMENNGFLEIYLSAIYCLTMTITTVGYGDVTCYSFNERIFQIILLLFGILAYSWIVSSIASNIEKNNNDLNDFTQKMDILKDIKLHHPNMSIKLYNKIIQHLKYRNRNEKHNKNLIFDCLPLSLKNNLIFEMYKPIITKFIFFKNIDNIDFIVKVVLAFRPVIAVKNDIMVNEGDMVEEIIFVKTGVLTVQLLINFENCKENHKKFSTTHIFNLESKSILEKTLNISDKTSPDNSIIEKIANHENKSPLNNNSLIDASFKYKMKKNSNEDENIKYIKIINIRENEHFGDVLMFSEQRSPMRVMVRSSKAELYLLKKEDVVTISIAYSNIWRRINEKSVYNFEQMKKSIQKIMEVLSSQSQKITNIETTKDESSINKKSRFKKDDIGYIDEKNNYSKQKNNENKYSKIISGNKLIMLSSSNIAEYIENSEIEKEIKKKDTEKKDSMKEQSKTDSSLQYSNIMNEYKLFRPQTNKKTNTKLILKNVENQFQENLTDKKRSHSSKCLTNDKKDFILNTDSIKNNDIHILSNQRRMSTPYRKEEVNQEIYANEKFDLTNVDENCHNLFSRKNFSNNLIKNINNIIDINSKLKIIADYTVEKLNNINIINNVNIKNKNKNNIISKGDLFSIGSSYENFNLLSKNVFINDKNLQKKIKIYLRNQIICQRYSHTIKSKNFNIDTQINEGNLVNNSIEKIKTPINKKDTEITINNISFDSKNKSYNNISIETPISKINVKRESNDSALNLPSDGCLKKNPNKSVLSVSPKKSNIGRKMTVNLNKSVRNFANKSVDKSKFQSNKSNINLLSLINGNILNSRENLKDPDKFYRRYFNALINNNSNKQNNIKKEKNRCNISRDNFSKFAEEYKTLSPKNRKGNKSCCNNKKRYN